MSSRKRIEELEKRFAADPTNMKVLLELGGALQQAGENTKAAQVFTRIAELYEEDGFFLKAIALLKQVQKLHERAEIHFRLAALHQMLGLTGEALAYLSLGVAKSSVVPDFGLTPAIFDRLKELNAPDAGIRLFLTLLLLRNARIDDARQELAAAAHLLRDKHPELADAAEQLDLTSQSEGAILLLRARYEQRRVEERLLRDLDFTMPN